MKSENCGSLRIKDSWVEVFSSVHLYTNLQLRNQIKIAKLKSYSIYMYIRANIISKLYKQII